MTDRAQDTEAIRAALDRLIAQDSFEAPYADAARAVLDRLVARLEAAEQRHEWLAKQLDGAIEAAFVVADASGLAIARAVVGDLRDARAALAAAAPGETTEPE